MFIRNAINNKFIERVAEWDIFGIENAFNFCLFECDFFEVRHVSLLFNIGKRIDEVSD